MNLRLLFVIILQSTTAVLTNMIQPNRKTFFFLKLIQKVVAICFFFISEFALSYFIPSRVAMTKSSNILRAMAIYKRKLEKQKNQVYGVNSKLDLNGNSFV